MMIKLLAAFIIIIKSCASVKVTCDREYTCTIKQLTTSQQLRNLTAQSLGEVSIIKLVQSNVPPEVVTSFQAITIDLILERCHVDKLILPANCTLQCLTLYQTTVLRMEVFYNTMLHYLSITNSAISSLLSSLYNLTALETVRLSKMHIPVFSFDVLHHMEKLYMIELNHDRIVRLQLTPNVTCCRNLSEIDLSFNRLSTVECALFSRMKVLRKLRLASNKIDEVHGSLQLAGLTELDLSNNRIKSIDLCRWNIEALMELNVMNNRIEHMFDCVGKLKSLMYVHFSGNFLTQLDLAYFAGLSLVYVDFSNNRIETVANRSVMPQELCVKQKGNPVGNMTDPC
uniref:Leucine rich immune protein (Coil-less) n=1 Tax=Anopheles christyi TaxID=43041 RepID=A0A182JT23_9DIPT